MKSLLLFFPSFHFPALLAVVSNLHGLLISFLILVAVLAVVAGLLYLIDRWIATITPPVRTGIAIILAILVLIWAVDQFVPIGS